MNGKWISYMLMAAVALGTLGLSAANADGPFDRLLSLRGVEADPSKAYHLTEDNGPWMIMACSFSGEGAQEQARELVLELRGRYKLAAYVHRTKFDFGEEAGRGIDRYGRTWRMHRSGNAEIEEIAVLVGNYQSVEDPDAEKVLRKLKHSVPKALDVNERNQTNQSLASWRMVQKNTHERLKKEGHRWLKGDKKDLGPMRHAFVTTNPLLPKDYFAPKGVDPVVVKMNKGLQHCLLDCPGKYTVQVATFKGKVIIEQSEIKAIQNGEMDLDGELDQAAQKARQLTLALRRKGYEAYQFHDRNASIVTVGSFNSVGTPRADGKTEINPEIYKLMRVFGARQATIPGAKPGSVHMKSCIGIPFDIQPVPVEVPKRSLSRELAHR